MDRNSIIAYLKEFAREKPYVNAMWLEGADGLGMVDEYSDIDFWFDVEKSHQESFLYACVRALERLSPADSRVDHIRTDIAQSNLHLENTSEYLTLDLCVQSHEIRGMDATSFARGDATEQPLVLFDKKGIITFYDYQPDPEQIRLLLEKNRNRLRQMSRVTKYIKRGLYLEAYMKYMEDVVEPLTETVRLFYTPKISGYGLCHISRHLPAQAAGELERFYKVTSLEEIAENLERAAELFAGYEERLREKYQF